MSDLILQLRQQIEDDPIKYMPAWTVALLDPTKGLLPRRSIDEEGTLKYAHAIAEAGAPGVLFAASTGWGHVRDLVEHRETLRVGGSVDLGYTIKQALLRIEDPLDYNIELINDLKDWGYGVVWTRRGSNLPPDAEDGEVVENLLPLADAAISVGLPMGIYSITTVDGAPLKVTAARLLLDQLGTEGSKNIVGVKITEPSFEDSTQTYLDEPAFQNKKIVQGWDAFYARALKSGLREDGSNQCGATSGAAACMVYAYKVMYEKALASDWQGLAEIQEIVSKVFFSMQGEDKSLFPDLQIAKRAMGLGHPLIEDRELEDVEFIIDKLEELDRAYPGNEGVRLIAESLLLMGEEGPYCSPYYERLAEIAED
jgi:dihydrodipicolinate synthase/N-acetylneuraminate lyase